jgi:hypothetical protein
MDSTSWENIKSKYKLDQFVQGQVEFHTHFGVFVNIDESLVKRLIKIPDFLDEGGMSPEMYPHILHLATGSRGYTSKTRLRGFEILNFSLVRAGGLRFCSHEFYSLGLDARCVYPEIGKTIGAVVVGYNESNCREVYLSAKPSVLHKALVPLKIPTLAG